MIKNNNNVGIIDIGLGNVGSIINMHRYLGFPIKRISKHNELLEITHLILPGVGSFDYAIDLLKKRDLFKSIQMFSENEQNKILGICLGMQLLLDSSDEGSSEGLGLIKGKVVRFRTNKVPHMGWNTVRGSNEENPFFNRNDYYKFYFVHSYYLPEINNNTMGITSFEGNKFTSAITNNKNVFGMQFHPEKSHDFGLDVFTKFNKL